MRSILAAVLALSLVLPCRAEDAKPNTLTPKEIAEGWILLFDGETTFGWDAAAKPCVEHGNLLIGGDQDVKAFTTTAFFHYELRLEYRVEKSPNDGIKIELLPDNRSKWPLTVSKGWVPSRVTVEAGRVHGSAYDIDMDGGIVETGQFGVSYPPEARNGPNKIAFDVPRSHKLFLRNIKLKPLNMKPVFNGKDLTGWKEFPDRKSKFTVTKEGWLGIKNGPGDLQTTGQWADFLLQLECKTNGDNLNSGVFFRCQPDKYQQGYEAQIQNQHAKTPKTYTIDEFDSQTHKLKDKQKVENWSQDYGTGAIYRRVPARRSLVKDREWFTMTVLAHGRHIATWVNGIQVVDWTDNRPKSDNGRNGFRSEKGPISLQGHDPTTDLSFRNIRIADLSGDTKK